MAVVGRIVWLALVLNFVSLCYKQKCLWHMQYIVVVMDRTRKRCFDRSLYDTDDIHNRKEAIVSIEEHCCWKTSPGVCTLILDVL